MGLKEVFCRMFCCKRKPENWMDLLESQYKKESEDMNKKEKLLHLDTEVHIVV
jgi:hypothetical protein